MKREKQKYIPEDHIDFRGFEVVHYPYDYERFSAILQIPCSVGDMILREMGYLMKNQESHNKEAVRLPNWGNHVDSFPYRSQSWEYIGRDGVMLYIYKHDHKMYILTWDEGLS